MSEILRGKGFSYTSKYTRKYYETHEPYHKTIACQQVKTSVGRYTVHFRTIFLSLALWYFLVAGTVVVMQISSHYTRTEHTRVGTLIVATIYLQLIQNRSHKIEVTRA